MKQPNIHCYMGLSLTPGPGRAESVGNPSSPCRKLVWGRTENRMKTVMKRDSTGKMQRNAVESHRTGL